MCRPKKSPGGSIARRPPCGRTSPMHASSYGSLQRNAKSKPRRQEMKHPGEYNLALLAGGEAGAFHRFRLDRHVRNCEDCTEKVAEFQALRKHLNRTEFPDLNWSSLAEEMRANIHVGLEAGACVRDTHV